MVFSKYISCTFSNAVQPKTTTVKEISAHYSNQKTLKNGAVKLQPHSIQPETLNQVKNPIDIELDIFGIFADQVKKSFSSTLDSQA